MADLSWKKVKFSSEEKALERIQSNKQTKKHFGLYHMIEKVLVEPAARITLLSKK